jgi:Rrf2 family protein
VIALDGSVDLPYLLGRIFFGREGGGVKLTSRSEYALLALVYLARHEDGNFVSAQTVATTQGIPLKFLEQILLILKRARYLRSSKGRGGGFKLARPAESISLAEVIRLFDGALAPTEAVSRYFYESTPIEKEGRLLSLLREVRDYVANKMETTTLAEMR